MALFWSTGSVRWVERRIADIGDDWCKLTGKLLRKPGRHWI